MRTVLITGAAQGIGYATAKYFAKQGFFVGLFDLNGDRCEAMVASGEFADAVAGHCDVTDRASVAAMFTRFAEAAGDRLDVLVNNAGVLTGGDFESMAPEAIDAMIAVNVRGLTNVAQAAYPLLKQTSGAVLVNLCSSSSIHGVPTLAVYSATKFYVNGLTQALNLEWEADDIHVASVKPPLINTAMGARVDARLSAKIPIKNEASDVAKAIWQVVQQRKLHHIMGGDTRLWYVMTKLLPTSLGKKVMGWLAGI